MPTSSFILLLSAVWAASPVLAQDADPSTEEQSDEQSDEQPAERSDEPGEVVVITGTRTARDLSDSVVTTDVITQEQVLESGASDASEVLESVPGVVVTRSFRGAGVQMQGMDSQYVLVLVNGQRMIGRRDGVIDLSRIPAERIERIEIVKGAASALYGSDAVAGVINIITRQPDRGLSSQTVASYGSRNTVDASEALGFVQDGLSAGLNGGWHQTDGYDWDPSDAQTDGNSAQSGSVDGELNWKVSPAVRLLADGSYQLRDSRGVDQVNAATFDRRNLTEDATGRVGAELLPSASAKVQLHGTVSLYRDQYQLDQQGGNDLDVYEDSRELLAQLDGQWDQVLGRNVFSLGAEGVRETLDSPRLSEPGERWRGATFVQDSVVVGSADQLEIVPSARLDADTWFGLHGTPRLAARWDATPDLAVRVNAGWGFRAPTFKEMYLLFENPSAGYQIEGNPDLQPETSIGLSAGLEAHPSSALTLRLDGFYNDLTNLITIDILQEATASSVASYSYINVARALTTGAELDLRLRLSRQLAADLGYTYTFTWDRDWKEPLDGRAPHRATVGLTGRSPALLAQATVRGEIVGPTRFFLWDSENLVDFPFDVSPYANMKIRVEKTVLPRLWRKAAASEAAPSSTDSSGVGAGLRLFAGVDNVFNAGDALYIHLDPRLVYAGLVFDLPVPDSGDNR